MEEILGASKDWDLDLTKMAMAAMGQNWKPADGIKDFLSISSIIVLANDWVSHFDPISRCYQMASAPPRSGVPRP